MAKLKDILDAESQRSALEQCRVVRLYAEGTFYRAYEWSAWLCVRYIQDFKATKRKFKNEEEPVVFVGFPVTSLSKFTPEGSEVTIAEDKSVELLLPAGVFGDTADVVGSDREWLLSLVPPVRDFLLAELGLSFHDGKLCVNSAWHGTEFLGAWLKPRRIYASRSTVGRMSRKLRVLAASGRQRWQASLNSYCGVLSHWQNYRLRRQLMTADGDFTGYGMFNSAYTKYVMLSIQNGTARYQNPNCAVFDSKLRSFSSETAQFETRNRAV